MKRIALMTDSSADISMEDAERKGLFVIRLPLTINDEEEFVEEETISRKEVAQRMRNGDVVKTSQAVIGKLIAVWEKVLEEYEEILYVPISSGLSGSYQVAATLAENYHGRVTVADAKFACYPLQGMLEEVQDLIKKGYDCKTLKYKIENETYMWAALLPSDLIYLKRGGRISPAAAALGNLLKIVPILKVENGSITVHDKVRTFKKAVQVAINTVCEIENPEEFNFYIVEAEMKDEAEKYAKEMEERLHQPIKVVPMYATILAHTGPDTIAFGYAKKLKG